mmetsp:Transcript_5629/g.13348  ORF Transcript_5629/g.13348 Transcript_5629/m.13348 type:complete len:188 (+) Transcript_5629:29-592(+)
MARTLLLVLLPCLRVLLLPTGSLASHDEDSDRASPRLAAPSLAFNPDVDSDLALPRPAALSTEGDKYVYEHSTVKDHSEHGNHRNWFQHKYDQLCQASFPGSHTQKLSDSLRPHEKATHGKYQLQYGSCKVSCGKLNNNLYGNSKVSCGKQNNNSFDDAALSSTSPSWTAPPRSAAGGRRVIEQTCG